MTKAAELAKIVDASGNVVTSGTVEPAGDTAAGDNAAIGFTSAEGIVITGQGSTNDVTIKNDADADVIEIPTGTTNVTVAGTLTATGFIIGSADINENDLESIDGITAGTVAASKAAIVDTNKDITGFRNITLTGELDAATLDISGNADIDGTLEADAITIGGTAIASVLSPVAGSSSIVTTGALNAGSITSGFGTIDTGSSNITSTGVGTFGSLDISGDIDVDGTTNLDNTDIDGTLNVQGETTLQTHLNMGDGDIIKLGASADLTIQHDGSNSIITDSGTGRLKLQGSRVDINKNDGSEGMAAFIEDAQVILYHNNAVKFQTTSGGIDVTGTVSADNQIFIEGATNDTARVNFGDSDDVDIGFISYNNADNHMQFATNTSERVRIDTAGRVGIGTGSTIQGSLVIKDTVDHNGSDVFVVAQNGSSSRVAGYRIFDEGGTNSLQMSYDNGGNKATITNPNNGSLEIRLGGTGTANAISDYEEGTFEATLGPSTSGTITINTNEDTLSYTKIGRKVTIIGAFSVSSVSSPVGTFFSIDNLPFAIGNLTHLAGRGAVSITYNDATASGSDAFETEGSILIEGESRIRVYRDASTVAANDNIYVNATYFTS